MEIKSFKKFYFVGMLLMLFSNFCFAETNVIIQPDEVIFDAEDSNFVFNITPNQMNFSNINLTNESITFDTVTYNINKTIQEIEIQLITFEKSNLYAHNIKTETSPKILQINMEGLYNEYNIDYLGFPITNNNDSFIISGITTYAPLNYVFEAGSVNISFSSPEENGSSFYSERTPYVDFNGSVYTEAGTLNEFILKCYNSSNELIYTHIDNSPSFPNYNFSFNNSFINYTGFINCTATAVKDTLNITKNITFEIKEIVVRNFTAYDLYDGKLITNFNLTLTTSFDSRSFNTTTGYINNIELFDAETLIEVVGSGYHNTYTYQANDTSLLDSWINASLYQTKLTVNIINGQDGSLLPGQKITLINNSAEYNYYNSSISETGTEIYYLGLHNYIISVNGTTINYTESSYQMNDTGDYETDITALGDFNIWIFDEATGEAFNMSSPDSITQLTYCDDDRVLSRSITNISDPWEVSCPFKKISFVVTYPDDTYTRTLLPLAFNYTNKNVSVWLIDLRASQAILNSFEVYDLISEYENLRIYFSKNIEGKDYIISSDYINIEESMGATLLLGAQYNVIIEADNYPISVLGFYDALSAGDKIIRLFDIQFAGDPEGAWVENFWQAEVDEDIGNGRIKVRYVVNDTSLATVYIYNGTEGTNNTLYSASISSHDNGTFLYDVPLAYENYTFEVKLKVNKTTDIENPQIFSKPLRVNKKIELSPVEDGYLKEYKLNIFLMLLLSIITLIFSISTADIGALIFIAFTGLFYYFKWVSISKVTLGLAILITIINFIKKKDLGK